VSERVSVRERRRLGGEEETEGRERLERIQYSFASCLMGSHPAVLCRWFAQAYSPSVAGAIELNLLDEPYGDYGVYIPPNDER